LSGSFAGTFYVDEMTLVSAGSAPETAVLEKAEALPRAPDLEQNYPNPFNSNTVIPFSLPVAGEVELAVFDLTGQQVARLVSGVRQAGTHAVGWDGRDDVGRELASGVYICRLTIGAGKRVEARKLTLLK